MRSFLYAMAVFLPVGYWGGLLHGDQGESLLKEYLGQSNQERLICQAFGSAAADMARAELTLSEADWLDVDGKIQHIEYSGGDFPIRNTGRVEVLFNPKSGLCTVMLLNTDGKNDQLGGKLFLGIKQKIDAQKDQWFQMQIDPYSGERLYPYLGHRIAESYLSGLAANSDALQNQSFYYSRLPKEQQAGHGIFRIGEQESIDSVDKFISLVHKRLVDPAEEYIHRKLQQRWQIFQWLLAGCVVVLILLFFMKKKKGSSAADISGFILAEPDPTELPPDSDD